MRFLIGFVAFSYIVPSCFAASIYHPKNTELSSEICIERPGDSGVLNIREANIIVSDKQWIPLIGEQAACIYVQHGSYFIYVQSRDPYDPNANDPKAWRSERLTFNLKKGQRVDFAVCGGSDGGGYRKWVIKPGSGSCE